MTEIPPPLPHALHVQTAPKPPRRAVILASGMIAFLVVSSIALVVALGGLFTAAGNAPEWGDGGIMGVVFLIGVAGFSALGFGAVGGLLSFIGASIITRRSKRP